MGLFFHILQRAVIHIIVDLDEQIGDGLLDIIEGHKELFARIAANQNTLVLLDILGAKLQTNGNALHLILGKLPAGALVGIVELCTELLFELFINRVRLVENALFVLGDRDNGDLDGSDFRRQDKSVVVGMYHNQRTDHAGRGTP